MTRRAYHDGATDSPPCQGGPAEPAWAWQIEFRPRGPTHAAKVHHVRPGEAVVDDDGLRVLDGAPGGSTAACPRGAGEPGDAGGVQTRRRRLLNIDPDQNVVEMTVSDAEAPARYVRRLSRILPGRTRSVA